VLFGVPRMDKKPKKEWSLAERNREWRETPAVDEGLKNILL
jgi:hypothetical protein